MSDPNYGTRYGVNIVRVVGLVARRVGFVGAVCLVPFLVPRAARFVFRWPWPETWATGVDDMIREFVA